MNPKDVATNLLRKLWVRRDEPQFWGTLIDEEEFLRDAPEMLVTRYFNYKLLRPNELKCEVPSQHGSATALVAGMINRIEKTIAVARNLPFEVQRFTLGHEIGHLLMHPGFSSHRDLLYDNRAPGTGKPLQERQADEFASHLLMPEKFLSSVFLRCFGGTIDGRQADLDLAFKLSAAAGQAIASRDLVEQSPFERASIIAVIGEFGLSQFEPLSKRFRVSKTAMAIQLVKLGLVA